MEQTKIIEGNKLIAEFMGGKYMPYTEGMFGHFDHFMFPKLQYDENFIKINDLQYCSSWDWLMPVIEKIEKQGYYTNILSADNDNTKHTIHITPLDDDEQYTSWYNSKIEAVWIGVVKFIKAEINNVQPKNERKCGKGQNIA